MIKGIRHTLENCGLTGGLGGARVGVQKTRSSHKAAMTRGTVPGTRARFLAGWAFAGINPISRALPMLIWSIGES
jgi:hypothetical protein